MLQKLLTRSIILSYLLKWVKEGYLTVWWGFYGSGMLTSQVRSNGVILFWSLSDSAMVWEEVEFCLHLICIFDDLSKSLKACNSGCMIDSTLGNHVKYADDLVILSPCSAGLQHLLNVRSVRCVVHDVKFDPDKSVVMSCRTKEDKCLMTFKWSGNKLGLSTKVKYLGHWRMMETFIGNVVLCMARQIVCVVNLCLYCPLVVELQ